MLINALVLSGCMSLVLLCFGLIIRYWYHRIRNDLTITLHQFIESPDKETPSPLAVLSDQIALLLAARLMQQIKAMLAGVESGASKGETAEALAAASDGSPWLGLIAGMIPKRIRNGLMRNPQMIGALSKLGQRSGSGDNGHSEAPPARKHRD